MSDLIARLLSAGTPSALVAEVAREIGRLEGIVEAASRPDAAAEKRRAWDRERKRQEREAERLSTGLPPDQVESADKADAAPSPNKSPPDPQKLTPIRTGGGTRAREATRLEDDWKPARFADATVAREVIDRRGREWGKAALESFKNHWRSANGPNARKRDWQAAWANWTIEQDRRDGRRNGTHSMAGHRGGSVSGLGRTVDAAQRAVALTSQH